MARARFAEVPAASGGSGLAEQSIFTVAADEDVGRLEVAVEHAVAVDVVERVAERFEEAEDRELAQRPLAARRNERSQGAHKN